MKPQWEKPELIVLLRTRPEEAVLAACKTGGHAGAGGWRNCQKEDGAPCNSLTGS